MLSMLLRRIHLELDQIVTGAPLRDLWEARLLVVLNAPAVTR